MFTFVGLMIHVAYVHSTAFEDRFGRVVMVSKDHGVGWYKIGVCNDVDGRLVVWACWYMLLFEMHDSLFYHYKFGSARSMSWCLSTHHHYDMF
jgi:hypothetical protein